MGYCALYSEESKYPTNFQLIEPKGKLICSLGACVFIVGDALIMIKKLFDALRIDAIKLLKTVIYSFPSMYSLKDIYALDNAKYLARSGDNEPDTRRIVNEVEIDSYLFQFQDVSGIGGEIEFDFISGIGLSNARMLFQTGYSQKKDFIKKVLIPTIEGVSYPSKVLREKGVENTFEDNQVVIRIVPVKFLPAVSVWITKIKYAYRDYGIEYDDYHQENNLVDLDQEWLLEKATGAPFALRIFMDGVRLRFERDYPIVVDFANWHWFVTVATVAGCVALVVRLHFDVETNKRTKLEMAVRSELARMYPDHEWLSESCFDYLKEYWLVLTREERSKTFFFFLAYWVFVQVCDDENYSEKNYIVAEIAENIQSVTQGYWG